MKRYHILLDEKMILELRKIAADKEMGFSEFVRRELGKLVRKENGEK